LAPREKKKVALPSLKKRREKRRGRCAKMRDEGGRSTHASFSSRDTRKSVPCVERKKKGVNFFFRFAREGGKKRTTTGDGTFLLGGRLKKEKKRKEGAS